MKKEDVVVSEPPAQRKAPSKRPKDAKASRAAKEDKQVDVEAAEVHEAQMRKSTRVRKPAIKEVHSHAPAEIAFAPTAPAWHGTAGDEAVSEASSRVCCLCWKEDLQSNITGHLQMKDAQKAAPRFERARRQGG